MSSGVHAPMSHLAPCALGSMGHASAIALGIATAKPSKRVVCFDGDGAMLMHMGNLASVAASGCTNFKHILINNFVHDSVGAQPTQSGCMDIPAVAQALGYTWSAQVENEEALDNAVAELLAHQDGPGLLEIRVRLGTRGNLGRPTTSPIQNKLAFMDFLSS